MLSVVTRTILLSVVMLSVVMLSVVAPFWGQLKQSLSIRYVLSFLIFSFKPPYNDRKFLLRSFLNIIVVSNDFSLLLEMILF
jgi:hypothetical protein